MTTEEIQRLKSSLRIEEVVGRYLPLTRRGSNYTALCPFHADHHASLSVSPARQTFTCFACGEKGDVFSFIEKMEHCSFQEAVAKCSPSVSLPRHLPPATLSALLPAKDNERFLRSLMPYASGHHELSGAYLDFEVGLSPVQTQKEWQAMRNRVIFPIRDEAGTLVGFAARRRDDSDTSVAKYINSSAADGYRKGETLYGLHRAKAAVQRSGLLFVTEGYKDAIAMHAAGFTNTVALSGTALTAAHISLIKRYADRVFLLLDADEAGRTATHKAVGQLVAAQIEADSIPLPEGEDPDSLFRKWGVKGFAAMLRRAVARPHTAESSLLDACLLYPSLSYPYRGGMCRFVDMLYYILPGDGVAFESPDYWQILRHLSSGATEATLPPALRTVAGELHLGFDHSLNRDLQLLAAMLPEVGNRTEIYLGKLLFFYIEIRLLRQIRRLVRYLLDTPVCDREKRKAILLDIAARRERLRHVSECLGRPGTISA